MTSTTLKQIGRVGLFGVRHAVASLLTLTLACVLWTLIYVALLLWAIVANGGLGGPLAYPGGLLFVSGAAALACAVMFFPSTAVAEFIASRRNLPLVATLPISVLLLALLSLPLALVLHRLWDRPISVGSLASHAGAIFGATLLPLIFYWAVAAFPPVAISALRALRNAIRLPNAPN